MWFQKTDPSCVTTSLGTLCKFATGAMETLPVTKHGQIPVEFYTSKQCPKNLCDVVRQQLEKTNRNLGGMLTIKETQVDKTHTPDSIHQIPAILVNGSTKPIFGTHFNEHTILDQIRAAPPIETSTPSF